MQLLLVFGCFVVITTAYKITYLEVPTKDEPQQEIYLTCHFKFPGDPPIFRVRWFMNTDEIFSIKRGQQPQTRTFNYTGAAGGSKGSCGLTTCTVIVSLPELQYDTMYAFTCEVTTDNSSFTMAGQCKEITTAVTLKGNPEIYCLPGTAPSEDMLLTCATQPAIPPAEIAWFTDGSPEGVVPMASNTQVSEANEFGLQSSSQSLRLRVPTNRSKIAMAVRCEATHPTYTRSSTITLDINQSTELGETIRCCAAQFIHFVKAVP